MKNQLSAILMHINGKKNPTTITTRTRNTLKNMLNSLKIEN